MTTTKKVTFASVLAKLKALPAGEKRLGENWYDKENKCFCTLGATCFPKNLKTKIKNWHTKRNVLDNNILLTSANYYVSMNRDSINKLENKICDLDCKMDTTINDLRYSICSGSTIDSVVSSIMSIMIENDSFIGKPGQRYRHMVKWLTEQVAKHG